MQGTNIGNMNLARMATVAAVTFIVAFARVSSRLAQVKAETLTEECPKGHKGVKVVEVTKPTTTLKLTCKEAGKVTPSFDTQPFAVCTKADCTHPPALSEVIPGATGTKDNNESATIQINSLPSTAKTFYIQCGTTNLCYIRVNVAQAPSPPGGVTTGSPLTCDTGGKAITIKIPDKGSTAQFTCGKLTLYPLAKDKVFAEDCKKEESLKNIVRSAKDSVYTLTADTKPPKKKWCFLCASPGVKPDHLGTASDYCLVHVESSSRTQSSSLIALAAMLPCVLAMLRIT